MKNFNFSLRARLALIALFVAGFAFFGCKPDVVVDTLPDGIVELSSSDTLVGKWADSYGAVYDISTSEFKNYGDGWSSYEGNNLVVGYTTDDKTEGYIYIKYTVAANEDGTYSSTAPDVGKWYAIAFKDLTSTTVKISGAYKENGATSKDTLEEAIAEFTIKKGYFSDFSDCTRQ